MDTAVVLLDSLIDLRLLIIAITDYESRFDGIFHQLAIIGQGIWSSGMTSS
jgi:hypothetical protein